MALSLIEGLGVHRDRAVDVDLDPSCSPILKTTHFNVGGEPDPDDLSALTRFGLATSQSLVVGDLEQQVERLLIVPGVEDIAPAALIGELIGLDEVSPANLGRVESS